MIQIPRRSVTRFFIPLIDVLILLFSVYLLLPLASSEEQARADRIEAELEIERRLAERERARSLRQDEGERITDELRREIEELRRQKAKALEERLVVRVLEIDGQTGRLFYRKNRQRVELRNEGEVRLLIEADRREHAAQGRELFYLILYPREAKQEHPTRADIQRYDRWFNGVAHDYDTSDV
jgi:hypothetical protein